MTSPFSHLLKKGYKLIWDERHQMALNNMKCYLNNVPFVSSYDLNKILLLYVSTILSALGAMLAQKDDNNKEITIYYISKTLLDYETMYTPIKNMCFIIVFLMKNLIHYILENITYIIV